MAVLPIVTAPAEVLSQRAREVRDDEFGPALEQLLSDMAETMYAAPGVGLAAPQVGDGRRVVVIDPGEREGSEPQLFRMVNPTIVERSKETLVYPETCLSVPDLEVKVTRNKRVLVRWRLGDGTPRERWFEEFEAVVVQHELDHLQGTVLLDRVSGFRRRRYMAKRKKDTRVPAK